MNLIEMIAQHAVDHPTSTAIEGNGICLDYRTLANRVAEVQAELVRSGVRTLALDMDNGPAWAVLDLAALGAGIQLVPIPPFFSPRQVQYCLDRAGVQAVVSDSPESLAVRAGDRLSREHGRFQMPGETFAWVPAYGMGDRVPEGVAKVTFTSGTTGEPKGVMLDAQQMSAVAQSLAGRVEVATGDRHLALTPLSVLLENICGLYAPLWCGATAILPSLAETGLQGASGVDVPTMAEALLKHRASTAIFTPHTLQCLVEYLEQGGVVPASLRFGAVGGAPVSGRLLERAEALGLPIREGYGLSECASVCTLNTLAEKRPGSAGRPLPHLHLRIADDGEVLVKGNLFRGYLGQSKSETENGWWRTGDTGRLDEDGFLHLTGRRRNIFITAFGRNVAPEWVEKELVLDPAIAQAAVFGEARPFNTAVILPHPGVGADQVEAALSRTNKTLPDYARITCWLPADEPFTPLNGQLSGTGRIKRDEVFTCYRERIEAVYTETLAS